MSISATRIFELQIQDARIDPPKKEVMIIKGRKFRFDYVWEDQKLAVEIHGGVFSGGRHTRGVGFTSDRRKMNLAQISGYRVLEFTSEQVKNGEALSTIKLSMKDKTRMRQGLS